MSDAEGHDGEEQEWDHPRNLRRAGRDARSTEAAREFAFNRACAIVLADGSAESQTPNLLLPVEGWKEGRIYEVAVNGSTRHLRGAQLLRRGDDYVRVTFEWLAGVPEEIEVKGIS